MTAPRKPTAAEAWRALEQMADDDDAEREMDRILALSDADLDRELAEAGIDPAEARARGEAIGRAVAERAPVAEAQPLVRDPAEHPRWRASGWAALVAAAFAAFAVALWVRPSQVHVDPDVPSPRLSAADRARALRAAARDDCAASRWDACVQSLDAARALDPAGDADPEVQGERRTAAEGTGAARPPVPPSAWGGEKTPANRKK